MQYRRKVDLHLSYTGNKWFFNRFLKTSLIRVQVKAMSREEDKNPSVNAPGNDGGRKVKMSDGIKLSWVLVRFVA